MVSNIKFKNVAIYSSLKDKKVIKYVKNVQIEHEKLKKQLRYIDGFFLYWNLI